MKESSAEAIQQTVTDEQSTVRELHEAAMAYAARTVGNGTGAPKGRAAKDPETFVLADLFREGSSKNVLVQ